MPTSVALPLALLLVGSPEPEPTLVVHESRLPVLVEVAQSGAAGEARPAAGPDGRRRRTLKRRPFTVRMQLQGAQAVHVFATWDEKDLQRKDLFCAGCGMADFAGNREWGLLMADDGQGFNYWHYESPDDHRCDPEPTPSSTRCWRTVWRINDVPLEATTKPRLFLVLSTGDTDPETWEIKETWREVWELELAPPAPGPPGPSSSTGAGTTTAPAAPPGGPKTGPATGPARKKPSSPSK